MDSTLYGFIIAVVAVAALFAHVRSQIKANIPFNNTLALNERIEDLSITFTDNIKSVTGRYYSMREGSYKGCRFEYCNVGDTQEEANELTVQDLKNFCDYVDSQY